MHSNSQEIVEFCCGKMTSKQENTGIKIEVLSPPLPVACLVSNVPKINIPNINIPKINVLNTDKIQLNKLFSNLDQLNAAHNQQVHQFIRPPSNPNGKEVCFLSVDAQNEESSRKSIECHSRDQKYATDFSHVQMFTMQSVENVGKSHFYVISTLETVF